jgi:hypothetical protein
VEKNRALKLVSLGMDETTRIAVHHLLAIWSQYGNVIEDGDTTSYLTDYMKAGEHAAAFIVSLGLGESDGYALLLNENGRAIERMGE